MFTGAGVSTESGIPDYRGPDGAWTKDPDAAKYVDIEHYVNDPDIRRRSWARRAQHPAWRVKPNAAHHALVDLEKDGRLRALITQNIDGLHQAAGSTPEKVVEVHGNLFGVECLSCGGQTTMRAALDRIAAGEADPDCLECGGILKSATIFFGQSLKPEVLRAGALAAMECDVFLAVGTSLTVHPVAGLVKVAVEARARLIICNAQPTPYDEFASVIVREPAGEALPAIVS